MANADFPDQYSNPDWLGTRTVVDILDDFIEDGGTT